MSGSARTTTDESAAASATARATTATSAPSRARSMTSQSRARRGADRRGHYRDGMAMTAADVRRVPPPPARPRRHRFRVVVIAVVVVAAIGTGAAVVAQHLVGHAQAAPGCTVRTGPQPFAIDLEQGANAATIAAVGKARGL